MADFDFDAALKGNVDSITAGLGDHDDTRLQGLYDAEGKGAKRAGVLKAIESEQNARKLTARAGELQEAAKKEGVKLHTDKDVETLAAQRADEIGKERDAKAAALETRIASLEKQLAASKARAPAKAKAPAKPRVLKRDTTKASEVDAEGEFSVAFLGAEDRTLGEVVPDLEFDAGAFEPAPGQKGMILAQPIEFPEGIGRMDVHKVALLQGDQVMDVVELVSPLPIGGGARSRIPEKYLRFDVAIKTPKKSAGA